MATMPGVLYRVRSGGAIWIHVPLEAIMLRSEKIDTGVFVIMAHKLEQYVEMRGGLVQANVWLRKFCRRIGAVEIPEEAVAIALESVSQQLSFVDLAAANFTADPVYTEAACAIARIIEKTGPS